VKAVNLLTPEHEHEFEASPGLPEVLPRGETLLWQGGPQPLALARQALHLDGLALYFGALLAWRGAAILHDGGSASEAAWAMARMLPLIALALGLVGLLAWLMARTTAYTVTDRRVVMRVGMVLSITFNLPFSQIAAAQWRPRGQGQGDITLSLTGGDRIAYLHLWPHVRPWRLKQTEPMLRALANASDVAKLLAQALAQAETRRLAQPPSLPLRPVFERPAEAVHAPLEAMTHARAA